MGEAGHIHLNGVREGRERGRSHLQQQQVVLGVVHVGVQHEEDGVLELRPLRGRRRWYGAAARRPGAAAGGRRTSRGIPGWYGEAGRSLLRCTLRDSSRFHRPGAVHLLRQNTIRCPLFSEERKLRTNSVGKPTSFTFLSRIFIELFRFKCQRD